MPAKGTIGIIKKKDDYHIEWKISDIFSYSVNDDSYTSPKFHLSEQGWYLEIYPAGRTDTNSDGWISLYFYKNSLTEKAVIYQFGLKKLDETTEKIDNFCWIFDRRPAFGSHKFFKKFDLLDRKSELVPSNVLTITCAVAVCKNFDSAPRTNALSINLLDMFTSKKNCDVTLQVKDERFLAHKLILFARSPVFATMLETPMKEQTTGVITIEDCDPRAFSDFLVFLYTGELDKLSDHMFELYKIAHKYDVQELKLACLITIISKLSEDTVCDSAIFADAYDDDILKTRIEIFFRENYDKIFLTPEWEHLLFEKPLLANELLKKLKI